MGKWLIALLSIAFASSASGACLSVPTKIQTEVAADGQTWHVLGEDRKLVGTLVLSCKADPNNLNSWVTIGQLIPERSLQICEGWKLDTGKLPPGAPALRDQNIAECQVTKVSEPPQK